MAVIDVVSKRYTVRRLRRLRSLRLRAVVHNQWKDVRTAAVIVSADDRAWYISRRGGAGEIS